MSDIGQKLTEQLVQAAKNSRIDSNLIEVLLDAIKTVLGDEQLDVRNMSVKEISDAYKKIDKLLNDQSGKLSGIIDLEDKKLELLQDEASDLKKKIEFMVAQEELDEKELENARKRFKELKNQIKIEENIRAGQAKGEAAAERLLQATFGISKGFENISKKGLMEGFKKGLLETMTISNILVSLGAKMFETMLSMDKARADLFSNAQITRDELKVGEAAAAMGKIGTDLEGVAAAAASSLKQNFRTFSDLTVGPGSQLEALTAGIGTLSKLGVDMNTASEVIALQVQAVGQTPEEANALLFNLAGVSQALQRPASELLSDFKNATPILARFEAEMQQKIFKDTALLSTKLGIEVNKLLQMNENMDTFEGAAKFAQSINIAFGAPLVSAQALLAAETPAEKRKIIMDSLKKEGRSIEDLSARQLRGVAADLGFGTNVAELRQYLNQEAESIGEDRAKLDDVATTMGSTQELISKQLSVGSKIDAAMQEMVRELVNAIGGEAGLMVLTDKIVAVIDFLSDNLFAFAGIMTAMAMSKFGISGASTVAALSGGMMLANATTGGLSEREQPRMEREREARVQEMTRGMTPVNAPSPSMQSGASSRVERALAQDLGGSPRTQSNFKTSTKAGPGETAAANISINASAVGTPAAATVEDGPGMSGPLMASPSVARNYVTPVFDKNDHFYAAKSDGVLAKMIKEITDIVGEIASKNSNLKLSMTEREAGNLVTDGLNAIKRV